MHHFFTPALLQGDKWQLSPSLLSSQPCSRELRHDSSAVQKILDFHAVGTFYLCTHQRTLFSISWNCFCALSQPVWAGHYYGVIVPSFSADTDTQFEDGWEPYPQRHLHPHLPRISFLGEERIKVNNPPFNVMVSSLLDMLGFFCPWFCPPALWSWIYIPFGWSFCGILTGFRDRLCGFA